MASNIVDFLETASTTLGPSAIASSSEIPTKPPFIPTIPVQPSISDKKYGVVSPPSTPSTPQASKISSPPSPPHTPHTPVVPTPSKSPRPIENPPREMATRFAPLVLPQNLDDMLTDYQRKIPLFDGTPHRVTGQQHVDMMIDFFDLHEIDAENVTMRLFVQNFGGEVRKWFRALLAASITTLANLQRQFLDHWEVKKNPLQILSEYENIKPNVGESVQDYCIRFNSVYNAIPDHIKPPMGLALIKFLDGFDPDMTYQLRERDPLLWKRCIKLQSALKLISLPRELEQRWKRR